MFKELSDAISWIESRTRYSLKLNLDKMNMALKLLGNPEKSFKSIHIAGTNGKGSVSSYLSNILKNRFDKVGLYTSPYVIDFNERIQINNKSIDNSTLLYYINYIYRFNEEFSKKEEPLSFFELTTLIAFLYFKDVGVDIAVIEVGLGGRLDATNVVNPLLSVITYIGKDHMAQLGSTYKAIAKEKLGIVKEGVPFISFEPKESILKLFIDKMDEMGSTFYHVTNASKPKYIDNYLEFRFLNKTWHTPLYGSYQVLNASLSIASIYVLNEVYGFDISDDMIELGLKATKLACRFEKIEDNVIIDGAHNTSAIESFLKSVRDITDKKLLIVYGAMKDKDYKTILKVIEKYTDKVVLTKVNYPRACNPKILYDLIEVDNKSYFNDYKDAIDYALSDKDRLVLIIGSLYLSSDARKYILKEEEDA